MLIDVARAYTLRKQVRQATEALARAAELGPLPDRDADRARQVISDLLTVQRPAPRAA